MDPRSLIVSLHDVTASTLSRVRRQLEELESMGVSRTSLLVVPHYHEQEKLEESTELVAWLNEVSKKGHELVLHGFSHQIPETQNEERKTQNDLRSWFFENVYTAGEAEFLNLSHEEAKERIQEGLDVFHKLGWKPVGFIPPAWLMNPQVERAVSALGLRYTNTISELVDLKKHQRYSTRSCVWSTRAGWRRAASLAWNEFLFLFHRLNEPLRISLHPGDIEHPAIWNQITRMIAVALKYRKPVTYRDWIELRQQI